MRTLLWFLGLFCATAFAQNSPGPKVIHVPRSTPSGPALAQTEPQGSYCEGGCDAVGQLAIRGTEHPARSEPRLSKLRSRRHHFIFLQTLPILRPRSAT